jgi:membrane complex biogenesis BtpA family protein
MLWPDAPSRPLIGMLHLPPLPGAPRFAGNLEAIRRQVLEDAAALVEGGAHAAILENFGDAPFYPGRVPAITIAHMTALAAEVRREFELPLGVNVLRNDGLAALAIAHAAGAQFIRVNVLCGARLTDQGVIQGIAHDLLRERAALDSEIRIFADVNVKHSAPLAACPLADEVADLIHRGGADAVIVSGAATGKPADLEELREVKAAAGPNPVLVGSGASAETISYHLSHADGFIVGTGIKRDGRVENGIDPQRVRALVETVEQFASRDPE